MQYHPDDEKKKAIPSLIFLLKKEMVLSRPGNVQMDKHREAISKKKVQHH